MKRVSTTNICRGGFQTRPTAVPHDPATARFPNRRSLRLSEYDYSTPGAYFVTACAYKRRCLFGEVQDQHIVLSAAGRIVENAWHALAAHYPGLVLDEFMAMPNHVHGIIFLSDGAPELSEIIRGFKTFAAKRINALRSTPGQPVWQRGFHDHVFRSEAALAKIREYVRDNPAKWHLDRENPDAVRAGLKPAPTNSPGVGRAGFKPAPTNSD
jgi:REP element-mobilizing transposase RayT